MRAADLAVDLFEARKKCHVRDSRGTGQKVLQNQSDIILLACFTGQNREHDYSNYY